MKRAPQKFRIGELLVRDGVITEQQLEEALALQRERGGKIVQNLILLQHLDRRAFLKFLSRQPGMASIELMNYTIPSEVINLIPGEFAVKNEIFPIDKMGSYLTVAMACPLDEQTLNELTAMTGLKVRALLVSLEDIGAALERYYPSVKTNLPTLSKEPKTVSVSDYAGLSLTLPKVDTAMTLDGVLNLISTLKTLPALPDTVHRIQAAIDNPDSMAQDVAHIIERDPALAAKMISLANSGAFAIRHKIGNVLMAVTMLGLREVYELVLSSAVIQQFENSKYFNYKAHWRRSLYCGTAAKVIKTHTGGRADNCVFAAGLLSDLGQLALAEVMPKRYAEVDQAQMDPEIARQESTLFGIAHPEVGYTLALQWGLPEEIHTPMRFHLNPGIATSHGQTTAMVALAASLADQFAERCDRDTVSPVGREAMAALGLQLEEVEEIRREADARFVSEI